MALRVWIAIVLVLAVSSEITEEDGVWVLTDDNFQEALSIQPDILVEFYAPWCGHCKKLAPEYAKAAKKLSNNNPPIRIGKVDATISTKIASEYQVQGYPTLKYFVNKSPIEYTGGRTEDTIVSWILKRNTPSLSHLASASELEAFLKLHKIAAVLFAQKDSTEASTFEQVSKSIDGVTFALSLDSTALATYEVSEPGLVLFKQFDEGRVNYSGRFTNSEISKFIHDNRLPWVLPFGDDAIDLIFKKSSPALFLFSNSYGEYQVDLEALSKEFKGVLVFSYADLRSPDNNKLGEYLGVTGTAQPIAVIVDTRGGMNKYKHTGGISYEGLKDFIKDWRGGKAVSYLKSEEVPKESLDKGVRVLVGKNFEEVVFDSTKDVLVEFYAPWCGHCKTLAPEYEKLANEFKGVNSVVIAKMDATANEARGVEIKGFPTLKFYPANSKKPVDYDGERNFSGLLSFVNEKASIPIGASKTDL